MWRDFRKCISLRSKLGVFVGIVEVREEFQLHIVRRILVCRMRLRWMCLGKRREKGAPLYMYCGGFYSGSNENFSLTYRGFAFDVLLRKNKVFVSDRNLGSYREI